MSSDARSRLAAQAVAAGYPPDLLAVIAHAALPAYQPGQQLQDAQIEQVTDAVKVLAQAGLPADTLAEHIAEYRRRHGSDWRQRFWARALALASDRYRRADSYGLSPCETDPAALAARIEVPHRLPPRQDGEPIRHLSHSSYSLWLACPEAWRLRYLQQRKEPTSGAMFLGSRVDDALSLYYRRIVEHHERLDLAQVKDAYRDLWHTELQAEEQQLGIDWHDIPQHEAFELGWQALELTFEQLVPKLGEPLAVQRRLEFALAPGLTEWTIVCYLDLETRDRDPAGEPIDRVVDYKVKGSLIGQPTADRDPQASLYLAGRWLESRPAEEFACAQIAKPGRQRKQMGAAFITTQRTCGQLRATLARIALAAAQIDAYYRRSLGVPFVSGLSGFGAGGSCGLRSSWVALLVVVLVRLVLVMRRGCRREGRAARGEA